MSDLSQRLECMAIPEPNSGCWIWLGATTHNGYGRMVMGSRSDGSRRSERAHRVAYEQAYGPIPQGLEVCHRCDIRTCINPEHLFCGTHAENMADRDRKGRNIKAPILRGELAPWAKLSDKQIAYIRGSTIPSPYIAKTLGVTPSYIRALRRGKYRLPPLPPRAGT